MTTKAEAPDASTQEPVAPIEPPAAVTEGTAPADANSGGGEPVQPNHDAGGDGTGGNQEPVPPENPSAPLPEETQPQESVEAAPGTGYNPADG